ncbi:M14 family zinc carboxypeptidase, partial [candidate division KSB1 bacterium]
MTSLKILNPTKTLEQRLIREGVDIIGGKEGEYILIYDTMEFAAELKEEGISVERMVPEGLLPDAFLDYNELKELYFSLQSDYPELVKVDSLGASVNGLGIWSVKISDNVQVNEDEIKFIIVGSYHGDEVLNVEVCINEIMWLLENYGTDAEATEWVNSYDFRFVPLVNPDGRMADPPQRRNMHNVDLNRNHSFAFRPGDPGGHGPYPFSEPETQAIKRLAESVQFTGSLNYHSYGRGILHPWGYMQSIPTIDEDIFFRVGNDMAREISYIYYDYSAPFYYAVEGGYNDYMYSEFGMIPFLFETYTTKIPYFITEAIELTNEETLTAFKIYLRRFRGSGVTGIVKNKVSGIPVEATFFVEGKEDTLYMKPRKSEPVFGRYFRLLESGEYDITFSSLGYISRKEHVVIDDSVTVLDVSLDPLVYPIVVDSEIWDGISGIGNGNANGLINESENIQMNLYIFNVGGLTANEAYAKITTKDMLVSLQNDSLYFGTILPGDTVISVNKLGITVSESILPGQVIDFDLDFYSGSNEVLKIGYQDRIQGFYDSMEEDDAGWIHRYVPGTLSTIDDWEMGEVYGKKNDPHYANSGRMIWGNDLGKPGYNGDYPGNVHNYLQMRNINTEGWNTVYLQFFRWLTKDVTDSVYISVNGNPVWESPPGEAIYDNKWTLQTIEFSSTASDTEFVSIRFGLKSDQSGESGGWNIDDILVADRMLLSVENPSFFLSDDLNHYILYDNYPNPFYFGTNIPFELKNPGRIKIVVYNTLGQAIKTLT